MLERAQEAEVLHGLVSGGDKVEVSHLQFADDTIIFLEGKEEFWSNLIELLSVFCEVSGMKINKTKSCVFGINFNLEVLGRLAAGWGCDIGVWPMVYLGLPLGGNPRASSFWNPVVEKVEKRLQNWKRACLSKGGRLTLIQAVLFSTPSYFMSLFRMPVGVAARLERLMRSFLWEGVEKGKGCHLANWERVIKDKEEGGLGLGSLWLRGEALRAKWLWRFPLEPNSLWHRVIKSKYGLGINGWDTKVPTNVSSRNPWRDISKGYRRFLPCCRFLVGNGERIRFWEDCWLKEGRLDSVFPRLYSLSRKKNLTVSSFFIVHETHLGWEFGFRRNLTEAEIGEVADLLGLLGRVVLSSSRLDKRVWEIGDHGEFSCKSFRCYLSSHGVKEDFPPFKSVWKACSPPKVQFFVWLVAIAKVNTCDQLQRRHPTMSLSPSWCVLCKEKDETCDHLFIHCRFALSLWWRLLRTLGSNWVIPRGCAQCLSSSFDVPGNRKKAKVLRDCLVHATFWCIWLERNNRIFQGHMGASAEEVWERVVFWASLWASVSGQFNNYHYSTIMRDMLAVLA